MPPNHKFSRYFRIILNALPVAVFCKKPESSVIWANNAAREQLSLCHRNGIVSQKSLQNLPLSAANNRQPSDRVLSPLLQALNNPASQQTRCLYHTQPLMLFSQQVKLPEAFILLSLIPETPAETGKRQTEAEEALAFDKLMSLISAQLINVNVSDLDLHVNEALTTLGEASKTDRCYIFLFDEKQQEMSNHYEWVKPGITSYKNKLQHIPFSRFPYFYQKVMADYTFVINCPQDLPTEASKEKQVFLPRNIQSLLCSALRADNTVIGFIGCDMATHTRQWSRNDLRRLKLTGDMIANAIQNVNYRLSLQHIQQALLLSNQKLQTQVAQDGLTGIANRRHFDEKLQQEIQRSARSQTVLSLVMLDIDLFKAYNDHYGHQSGDLALKQVAHVLKHLARRQGEIAARYGGEEFALILPGTDHQTCLKIAEKARRAIQALQIPHDKSEVSAYLTASIGCYSCIATKNTKASQLIAQADDALYRAKHSGRNNVQINT
ncbi:sensor domain-containing diguanylate cyclase [Chromatiaceae bacterium AAb-1]|nr:sensor domain-containing diguanylate cyclase [Chromatiaceae bacterium AAb-1]